MEVKLKALADFASVTSEGKLNIMGIFDEINPPALPFVLPLLHLVISYDAGPAEFDMERSARVVLLTADGQALVSLEQPVRIPRPERPGARAQVNQIVALAGITLDRPGDYSFAILIDNDEKAAIPFHVNDPPATQPHTGA